MELRGLRDDVYRRPLATALDRLGIGPGWTCVDVGAGGGDVSVALAEIVGRDGRVYAVDSDPTARDEVAEAAAAHSQVLAITQAGEDLRLPEPVDLAFCRFLLLHVVDPGRGARPHGRRGPSRRVGGGPGADHLGRPDRRAAVLHAGRPAIPTSAPCCPRWPARPGWSPSTPGPRRRPGPGPGPVADYLSLLTEVDPGDDPVVLPPLVTVVAQAPLRA